LKDNREQFLAALGKYLEELYGPCDDHIECESPIEAILYQALGIVNRLSYPRLVLSVHTQHKIGNFRVDFLINAREEHEFRNEKKSFAASVIVECDGHDFHEKTKEQALRDKSRDRALQQFGHKVFHFTGSEIWNDPFTCAIEILEFLSLEAEFQAIDYWKQMSGDKS